MGKSFVVPVLSMFAAIIRLLVVAKGAVKCPLRIVVPSSVPTMNPFTQTGSAGWEDRSDCACDMERMVESLGVSVVSVGVSGGTTMSSVLFFCSQQTSREIRKTVKMIRKDISFA